MSNERMKALEAVAKAGWAFWTGLGSETDFGHALKTWRALPAQPQPVGEVVTLAVWGCGGNVTFTTPTSRPTDGHPNYWHHMGTVTLPIANERAG